MTVLPSFFCAPADKEQNIPNYSLELSRSVLYDIHHLISTGRLHDRPGHCNDRHRPAPGSIFDLPADRGPRSTGGDRNPCHQYPAAVAAADGGVAPCLDRGGDVVDHGFPRGIRDRAIGGWADLGSLRPALAGADRLAVFCAGSIWCGLATDLPGLLIGRVIQAAGACSTSVLSRA